MASALLGIRSPDNKEHMVERARSGVGLSVEMPMGANGGGNRAAHSQSHADFRVRGISMASLAPVYPQGIIQSPSLASLTNLLQLQGYPNLTLSRDLVNGYHPLAMFMPPTSPPLTAAAATVSLAPASVPSATVSSSKSSTASSAAVAQPIEQAKIESALKSTPQRGKKRNELNDEERHELTRSRNREHARATRVRKKRKYEELVEKETQLEQLLQKQELEAKRREAIIDLFRTRESRIRSMAAVDESTPQLIDAEQSGHPEEHAMSLDKRECLKETLRMRKFDDELAKRVEIGFGRSSLTKFTYSIVGQASGVALDGNDGALATVELMVPGESTRPLVKGLVYIRFLPKNYFLKSVTWTTLEEAFVDSLTEQSSRGSSVSLEQLAPSTVG